MKRSEAIELCFDHLDIYCGTTPEEHAEAEQQFLSNLISDSCHNVAVCASCEETFDIEPDAANGQCPYCSEGKYYTLTFLLGVPI